MKKKTFLIVYSHSLWIIGLFIGYLKAKEIIPSWLFFILACLIGAIIGISTFEIERKMK